MLYYVNKLSKNLFYISAVMGHKITIHTAFIPASLIRKQCIIGMKVNFKITFYHLMNGELV